MAKQPTTGQRKSKEVAKEVFEPILIDSSIPYKLKIEEDNYDIDYFQSVGHDFAAVLIARRIVDQAVIDIDVFKKLKHKMKNADKVNMDKNYSRFVMASQALATISDELLGEALRISKKK